MDTKKKKQAPVQERRPRQPEAEAVKRRRPAEEAVRQRPAGESAKRRNPQPKAAPAREPEAAPRTKRPAGQPQQRSKQQRPAAEQPRRNRTGDTRREPGVHYSAPQGTGPRKSAPTPSEKERAAQRKKVAQKPKKKQANFLQEAVAIFRGDVREDLELSDRAKKRQEQRKAKLEKRRKQAARNNTPAVIYTQPAVFNSSRLLIQLLTVTAVVVALIMGLSVFFKVEKITVSGAEVYSTSRIRDASGIQEGDNLLTFSRPRAAAQIRAKLPYVEKVRIGIKLPETVILYIEELDVSYAIKSVEGAWWLMNSNGRLIEPINNAAAKNYTQILGVTLADPKSGEEAIAAELVPVETVPEGEEPTAQTLAPAPVTVTGAQRLFSALQILKALEANDIVGEAASVDVTRQEDIVLWYGSRYQVNLGDSSRMEYKIACMNDVILQMSDYDSGVLDISFTTFQEQVGYTPFD